MIARRRPPESPSARLTRVARLAAVVRLPGPYPARGSVRVGVSRYGRAAVAGAARGEHRRQGDARTAPRSARRRSASVVASASAGERRAADHLPAGPGEADQRAREREVEPGGLGVVGEQRHRRGPDQAHRERRRRPARRRAGRRSPAAAAAAPRSAEASSPARIGVSRPRRSERRPIAGRRERLDRGGDRRTRRRPRPRWRRARRGAAGRARRRRPRAPTAGRRARRRTRPGG